MNPDSAAASSSSSVPEEGPGAVADHLVTFDEDFARVPGLAHTLLA